MKFLTIRKSILEVVPNGPMISIDELLFKITNTDESFLSLLKKYMFKKFLIAICIDLEFKNGHVKRILTIRRNAYAYIG